MESVRIDICEPTFIDVVAESRPQVITHFAAETHVTRSETQRDLFYRTNVEGTLNVLKAAASVGADLVVHISTDEIYGPCTAEPFLESDKQPGEGKATSPYAKSKALADDAALEFREVPVLVARLTNCFGPWQHPEKAVPRWITRALRDLPLPVWGDGLQVRDWMHIDDACAAIRLLESKGTPGEAYNVAPEGTQVNNFQMAGRISDFTGTGEESVYLTSYDRPHHDRRYAIDSRKVRELGWLPGENLWARLEQTVRWYVANRSWWEPRLEEAESLYDDSIPRRPVG